jgi:hypothetical protein
MLRIPQQLPHQVFQAHQHRSFTDLLPKQEVTSKLLSLEASVELEKVV